MFRKNSKSLTSVDIKGGRVIEDRNFDDLTERLKTRIYGSPKGRLRIDQIWTDFENHISGLNGDKPLTILDAGGGLGQISLMLARKGHDIVFCDISEKMIEEARILFYDDHLEDRLTLIHAPFQALPEKWFGAFDLVMSHAVLEWLGEPEESLKRLFDFMKPDGTLSLMFYNQNALIQKNALKGNIRKILGEHYTVGQKGLTPQHPLDPDHVAGILTKYGLNILQKTGIRVFYDYMTADARLGRSYEEILSLESRFCRVEPFASLGRYVHLIANASFLA